MNKNNREICEDQIVTFKQSHILLYQGLLFFNMINMYDHGRTITHMQIPRFHTQVWYNTVNRLDNIRSDIWLTKFNQVDVFVNCYTFINLLKGNKSE